MRHQDDGFGAMFTGIFDRWESPYNALVVGDFLGRVKRNIEINLWNRALV
jgi:hypothetical protein